MVCRYQDSKNLTNCKLKTKTFSRILVVVYFQIKMNKALLYLQFVNGPFLPRGSGIIPSIKNSNELNELRTANVLLYTVLSMSKLDARCQSREWDR